MSFIEDGSSSHLPQTSSFEHSSSKTKRRSFRKMVLQTFRSGLSRRSSDDSTISNNSMSQDLTPSSLSSALKVPPTIDETAPLTKEQLDTALRNEQIEQAATERDEKRKRRVKDALSSLHRRLGHCADSIQAEFDEWILHTKWSDKENQYAVGILVLISISQAIGQAWVNTFVCLGLMYYSHRSFAARNHDARVAADNVSARLDDVEDGVNRCELALQFDLEREEEWASAMEQEKRDWEERQRELLVRRGRTLHSLNTRRKKFVEQIRSQVPDVHDLQDKVEKVRSMLDPRHRGSRSNRNRTHSRISDEGDHLNIRFDEHANPGWIKYVQTNLPIEFNSEETEEEVHYHQFLVEKSEGKFAHIPRDIQLMVLRGYADKKDRLKESLDAINYIIDWRAKWSVDDMLKTASEEAKVFFGAWFTRFGGEDMYGHVMVYDRVEDLNLSILLNLADENVLANRTKQMEVLRRVKLNTSERLRHRICKHIYILDLSGLSMKKHFTSRVRDLLQGIFKVGGDGYPDSLWSLWLINAPMVFNLIWKVLSPGIDSVVKSKIRIIGGKEKYIPEMERCGIPRSSIPKELGGDFESIPFYDTLLEFVEDERNAISDVEKV